MEIHLKNAAGQERLQMTISCRELALNLLYKAFDDVVSGAVNAMDALGRFVNLVHTVNIPEQRASLGELRKRMQDDCPLSTTLDGSSNFIQLSFLRPIRGVLQHSAYEHLLRKPESDAGGHGPEPKIADEFDLGRWSGDRAITRFTERVVDATESLLLEVVGVLACDPKNAVRIK
jgi:hypothetical protein